MSPNSVEASGVSGDGENSSCVSGDGENSSCVNEDGAGIVSVPNLEGKLASGIASDQKQCQ